MAASWAQRNDRRDKCVTEKIKIAASETPSMTGQTLRRQSGDAAITGMMLRAHDDFDAR
jgi:hypothetical protein